MVLDVYYFNLILNKYKIFTAIVYNKDMLGKYLMEKKLMILLVCIDYRSLTETLVLDKDLK